MGYPSRHSFTGWFSDLKLNRAVRLPLHHNGPSSYLVSMADIAHLEAYEVTCSKLAVDGKIEHRQLSPPLSQLQADADGPNVLQFEGCLLADQLALIPRGMALK